MILPIIRGDQVSREGRREKPLRLSCDTQPFPASY